MKRILKILVLLGMGIALVLAAAAIYLNSDNLFQTLRRMVSSASHTERPILGKGERRADVPQKNGRNHGLAKYWHGNGQLYAEIPWKEGEKHGTVTLFREDGSKESVLNYFEGKEHGVFQWFHSNDSLHKICRYEKGKPVGTLRSYHPSGMLSNLQQFTDGAVNGPVNDFDEMGRMRGFRFIQGGRTLFSREFEAPPPDTGFKGIVYKSYYANLPPYGSWLTAMEKIPIEKWRTVAQAKSLKAVASELAALPISELRLRHEKTKENNLLLISHDAIVDPMQPDKYFSLFAVDLNGGDFPFSFHGPFLVGRVLDDVKGRWLRDGERLYLGYDSCTECGAFVYVHVVSFKKESWGHPYLFSCEKDVYRFGLEMILPGHGHSPDGTVETRISTLPKGEQYLQSFRLGDEDRQSGKLKNVYYEFCHFQCLGTLCVAPLVKEQIPKQLKSQWSAAVRLTIDK